MGCVCHPLQWLRRCCGQHLQTRQLVRLRPLQWPCEVVRMRDHLRYYSFDSEVVIGDGDDDGVGDLDDEQ